MTIKKVISRFGGMLPILDKKNLPEKNAVSAENVKIESGALEPIRTFLGYASTLKTGTIKTIYRFGTVSGSPNAGVVFYWNEVVDIVRGLIDGDTTERTYFTGVGAPKVTDNTIALVGGGFGYPNDSYDLGVPTPANTITVTAQTTATTGRAKISMAYYVFVVQSGHYQLQDVEVRVTYSDNSMATSNTVRLRVEYFGKIVSYVNNGAGLATSPVGLEERELNGTYTDNLGVVHDNTTVPLYVEADQFLTKTVVSAQLYLVRVQDFLLNNTPVSDNLMNLSVGAPQYEVSAYTEVDKISYSYLVTYVDGWGQEGPASLPTAIIDNYPGGRQVLESIPTNPGGNFNIVSKNIYRAATGATQTDYFFLTNLAIGATTFIDTKTDEELGEAIVTRNFTQPPSDMHSIIGLENGIMLGASKNRVCISEAYIPYAFNPDNFISTTHPIVGMGSLGGATAVAMTEKNPYLIIGNDPASFSAAEIKIDQGCIAKRSIVSGIWGVVYASPDGLVLISAQGNSGLITKEVISKKDWQAYNPKSILAACYDGKYYAFYDTGTVSGGFIFDPLNPTEGLIHINLGQTITALYADPLSDRLYIQYANQTAIYEGSNNIRIGKWGSGDIVTEPVCWEAVRIAADNYGEIEFRLYVNNVLKATKAITSNEPVFLPGGYTTRLTRFEIDTKEIITKIVLSESASDLG